MARKKITVVEASGNVRTIMVAEAEGNVEKWLDKLGVDSFVDSDSAEIIDFESLQDGGTYTLGPPRQQQHGEFCCSFCFALCCAILYASFVVRTRFEFNGHNSSVLVLFYSMR